MAPCGEDDDGEESEESEDGDDLASGDQLIAERGYLAPDVPHPSKEDDEDEDDEDYVAPGHEDDDGEESEEGDEGDEGDEAEEDSSASGDKVIAKEGRRLVQQGNLTVAGQAAAELGQAEYNALCEEEGIGAGRVGTGRAAKRAAMKQLGAERNKKAKTQPPQQSQVHIHCQLFLTKEALAAKQSGAKAYEGRWGPQAWRRKKWDNIQYFCNPITNWQIDSEPRRWSSIRDALGVLGWRRLMPWASSEEDTFVRYCVLYAKADLNVETAREWERLHVSDSQPFMTWHDVQIAQPAATSKPAPVSPRKPKVQDWGAELTM